jgi:hypothetical protein
MYIARWHGFLMAGAWKLPLSYRDSKSAQGQRTVSRLNLQYHS